jgi:hypothetical protein
MARTELQHQISEDGFHFRLREVGRLTRRARDVPVADWAGTGHAGAQHLRLMLDNDAAFKDGLSITVDHDTIASMPAADLRLLGLPAPCPRAVLLESKGALSDEKFRIELAWLDLDGVAALGAARLGASLRIGGSTWVVLHPLLGLVRAVDALNAVRDGEQGRSLLDAKMVRMAALSRALTAVTGDAHADKYLRSLTICHATGLALAGLDEPGGPIHPVLLGDSPELSDGEADNEDRSKRRELLLPAHDATLFARSLFASDGARPHYRLRKGAYVVVDPAVEAALGVVARVNAASPKLQAEFRADPRAFLTEAIEQAGGSGDILALDLPREAALVYGERVTGVGEWKQAAYTFAPAAERDWFGPEDEFATIPIEGSSPLIVARTDLSDLRERVEAARQAGSATVEWNGRAIPVTDDLVQCLRNEPGLAKPLPADPKEKEQREPDKVLLPAGNEQALAFAAGLRDPETRCTGQHTDLLCTTLYPHQMEALSWLQVAYRSGMPGVLLADDMGLGKTIEVLAFLAWLRSDPRSIGRPVLIVAPSKLLDEWREQIGRHLHAAALGLPVLAYEQHLRGLKVQQAREARIARHVLDLDRLQKADWVLTTYETMRDYEFSFGLVKFHVAIFDEAQKVKSLSSRMNKAARSLNTDFTILMTGTPVENSPLDLWTLLDIGWPGFLAASAKEFAERYRELHDPIVISKLKDKVVTDQRIEDRDYPRVMLRRFKTDILKGLPARHENHVEEMMPEAQAAAVDAILAEARREAWPAIKALQALRRVCLHPQLHAPSGAEDSHSLINMSARFRACFRILDEIRERDERALIFVEFHDAQTVLQALLRNRYGLQVRVINGETPAAKTKAFKDAFQSGHGFDVLLLGPKSAGFGLTLTSANHVIHLSRWWNPAVEDQCSDRVYRIGQTRGVTIHIPLAVHPRLGEASFDKVLDGLLREKRSVSREIVVPTAFTEQDVRRLWAGTTGSDLDIIPELDGMDWRAFEQWAAEQFRKSGYAVDITPRVGDAGCDLIARLAGGGRTVVCQCKHRSNGGPVDDGAMKDLVRLDGRYSINNPIRLAVTNGLFSLTARTFAGQHDITWVDRNRISNLSTVVSNLRDAGP